MTDSRPTVVLFGAIAVVVSLFTPWYALDVNDQVRNALAQDTGQLPGVVGEFARSVISLLPNHIVANGWEVFDKADWIMTVCAVIGLVAALGARMDLAKLASAAAIVTIILGMVIRTGPVAEFVNLQWGAWLGLCGAALMMVGACMRGPAPVTRGEPLVGWAASGGHQPVSALRDTSHSVPPPG